MRMFCYILIFLLFVDSSDAYARGGPGIDYGDLLKGMLLSAIVGGLIAGVFCGRVFHRTPWKSTVFLSLVLVTVGLVSPIFGSYIYIPGFVFVAMFVSVSDIVRYGLPDAKADVSLPLGGINRPSRSWVGVVRYILRWLAGMYAFWAAVSLLNLDLLGFLVIPPVILLIAEDLARLFPFLLPPLAVAAGIAIIVTVLYFFIGKKTPSTKPYLVSFIFNGCILFTFMASAEIYRCHLMSQSLIGHAPNQFQRSSFLGSVFSYRTHRERHATFIEGGRDYFWSYSERKFILRP